MLHVGLLEKKIKTVGILYETYNPDVYWFESIALARRSLFVVTVAVLPVTELDRSQILVFLCIFCFLLHVYFAPYVWAKDTLFETASLISLICITLIQTGRREDEVLDEWVAVLMTLFTLSVFALFVFLTLYTQPALNCHKRVPASVSHFLKVRGIVPVVLKREASLRFDESEGQGQGQDPESFPSGGAENGATNHESRIELSTVPKTPSSEHLTGHTVRDTAVRHSLFGDKEKQLTSSMRESQGKAAPAGLPPPPASFQYTG